MQGAGQIEEAQCVVREVLELDPANRKARQMQAGMRAEQQRRVLQERLRVLFQEAEEEAAARRFARAVEVLNSAVQLEGRGGEAERRQEQMCARLEQCQNAAQLLADARQLLVEEDFLEAHAKASEARALDPDRPEADELLRAIAEAEKRHQSQARIDQELAKASALLQAADYDAAIAMLLELHTEFPDSPWVDLWLARGEAEKAEHERKIRLEGELCEIRSLIAQELAPKAAARLRVLADEFPKDVALQELLVQAEELTRRAEAIENLRIGCNELLPRGEFDQAIAALDTALATYPADPAILALKHEVEQERQAFRTAAATREALAEAEWLLSQDRPHLAAKFLREKSAELPGQPDLVARLDAIEETIPGVGESPVRARLFGPRRRAGGCRAVECSIDADRSGA